MYQVIYLDIDEEITSVIEKLRNTKTKEVFLSVPSRALILQSIVSLKLLKKEAEKLDKSIVVITGDAREQVLTEKAGIQVKESLEGMDTEGEVKEAVIPQIATGGSGTIKGAKQPRPRQTAQQIGSPDFFDITEEVGNMPDWEKVTPPPAPKRMMVEVSREAKPSVPSGNPSTVIESEDYSRPEEIPALDNRQSGLIEDFIQDRKEGANFSGARSKRPAASAPSIPVSRKIIRMIVAIIILAVVLFGLAAAYLFIPRAEVKMIVKKQILEKELELKGDSARQSVELSERILPLRIVEREEKYFFSYPVTGKGTAEGQKARGMVTIYNEYNTEPQSLVATTRLVSPDKKIFRLVKGVTVPGMTEVGGQSKPGAIEAEVIADEAGEGFNIEPTTFKIPGFEGSPKYDKFYARSSAKMAGGSSSGSPVGGGSAVADGDIVLAKSKSEAEAKVKIREELERSLSEDDLVFQNASEETILESSALSRSGDKVTEFQYQVAIRVKALVFSASDIRKIFLREFSVKDGVSEEEGVIELDYGAVSGDLSAGTATMRVHGTLRRNQEVDADKFKREIAGKNIPDIQEVIRNYPQIEEVEIGVSPAILFKKVPHLPSRIEVIIEPLPDEQSD